jgi:hypothetical protein
MFKTMHENSTMKKRRKKCSRKWKIDGLDASSHVVKSVSCCESSCILFCIVLCTQHSTTQNFFLSVFVFCTSTSTNMHQLWGLGREEKGVKGKKGGKKRSFRDNNYHQHYKLRTKACLRHILCSFSVDSFFFLFFAFPFPAEVFMNYSEYREEKNF